MTQGWYNPRSSLPWRGRHANPDTLEFLERTPTRKRFPRSLCMSGTEKVPQDKDFAELSGELSGAKCLKTFFVMGSALELFRKFLGTVRAFFGFGVLFRALEYDFFRHARS